ncbi:hypothetical protein [Taibaiella koreensis]|uniref:hypothetical protein n=1 Tax=Taibaiella koreensis TaxID=1268548 RepID=UPI000E599E8C|nr:hypothetical protein [Taibaiella koreensis]
MKKHLYYKTVVGRKNPLTEKLQDFFLSISSYPMLLVEVFLRRNMGERYFSLSHAVKLAVVLLLVPTVLHFTSGQDWGETMKSFWSMYLFAGLFIWFAHKRYKETCRPASEFDFSRYSLSAGDVFPFFKSVKQADDSTNYRKIEILLEPLLILAAGVLLLLMAQFLMGGMLVLTAIIYHQHYDIAYKQGDEFVLDMIDEMIVNRDFSRDFIHDETSSTGFRTRFTKKPSLKELREELNNRIDKLSGNDDEDDDAALVA